MDTADAAFWICEACAVEHDDRPEVCAICADERQYVPSHGQRWTTLDEMAALGFRAEVAPLEPDLFAVTSTPEAGIGQQSKIVRTAHGNVLWDPLGFVDADVVRRVRALGDVVAVVASHPHMFGVQVEWSRRLGGVPVVVAQADARWVARRDSSIRWWSDDLELVPGVTLNQPGGHNTQHTFMPVGTCHD